MNKDTDTEHAVGAAPQRNNVPNATKLLVFSLASGCSEELRYR